MQLQGWKREEGSLANGEVLFPKNELKKKSIAQLDMYLQLVLGHALNRP